MRAFFAVELSAQAHAAIASGVAELRRRLPPARWVRPENVHVTMRFLGEVEPAPLEALVAPAQDALRPLTPVTIALAGGGFFPHARRPRVAWLGGRAEGLERWAAAIERCVVAAGIEPEPRAFSLHVTLARLERPWDGSAADAFVAAVAGWRLPPFEASEVVLFTSELRPSGAIYTPLHRLAAGG